MKGLYSRFAVTFIGITCGILFLASIVFIWQTHYHFAMYQHQAGTAPDTAQLNAHFEQALVQSVIWVLMIGIVMAAIVSLYVAKRLTSPLLEMKSAAVSMAGGDLRIRTKLHGNDEISDLGQSLNHLAEQLEKQEQLRKMMTADVAHELRTPLATLKSHMEAMIEGVWDASPERLRGCHEEIERMIRLVGDLEQLTQLDSPHFQLNVQPERMDAIAAQCVETIRAAFEHKGVRLELRLQEQDEPRIASVDRQRVSQILLNVLSNALKYTPPGKHVEVDVKRDKQTILIQVKDTGPGIGKDDLPYLFERFYRADKSRDRKSGGSGIGLTIAKKLTEAHRGSIQIDSEPGRGTTVRIYFPV
ncbi:sensor histidine kinase [Paenibacillus sp. H1-7]|uniref:sensor histidine kinase n=1 Tax=Paenibacillus sp. H1-7 TaxID=2282849 RepID=UPI001EF77D66|nr:HAMP domain-containing sensor histidine kinase [Paenibacillus sp. H1-7]ULL14077.1 sensor histidine kinase [Paenibacillus sp. H1-7]